VDRVRTQALRAERCSEMVMLFDIAIWIAAVVAILVLLQISMIIVVQVALAFLHTLDHAQVAWRKRKLKE